MRKDKKIKHTPEGPLRSAAMRILILGMYVYFSKKKTKLLLFAFERIYGVGKLE